MYWYQLTSIVIESLLITTSLVSNVTIIYLIYYYEKLRTKTNMIIGGLSLVDLIAGCIGIPCALAIQLGYPRIFYGCIIANCILLVIPQVSIFSVLVLSIERMFAIIWPFVYHKYFSIQRALGINCLCWICGLCVGFVPLVWHIPQQQETDCKFMWTMDINYKLYFNLLVCSILPLAIMFVIYFMIYRAVKPKFTRIDITIVRNVNNQVGARPVASRRELKAAKKLLILLMTFAVCLLPIKFIMINLTWTFENCPFCLAIAFWVNHFNFTLNPFLYTYGNRAMKKAMHAMLYDLFPVSRTCISQPVNNEFSSESDSNVILGIYAATVFKGRHEVTRRQVNIPPITATIESM